MQREEIVPASEFCLYYNIELSFIHSLQESGMIQTVVVDNEIFLPVSGLEHVEKITRLHFELDINLEGIETISHLLARMNGMQQQINQLTTRLKAYES